MSYDFGSNNAQLIASLCVSLSKKGVVPTVALIKKHAVKPLPLPEIISVLKNWKLDPNHYTNADLVIPNTVEPEVIPREELIQSLEARIAKLEKQMATLLKPRA